MDGFTKHLNMHRMDGIYLAVSADQCQLDEELEGKAQLYEADDQSILGAVSSSAETKHEPVFNSVIDEESTFEDTSSTVCDEVSSASVSKEQIESVAGAAEVHHVMRQKLEKKDVMTGIMELGSKKSNQLLVSLNLPAATEDHAGDRIPSSLQERAAEVRRMGGIEHLTALIDDLPALSQRNKEILDESERALNEEEVSDRQLRAQFRQNWTRTPSEVLNQPIRGECTKYRQIINSALQADSLVRQRYVNNRDAIAFLSQQDRNHAELDRFKVQSQTGVSRDFKLKELASAYDSFIELNGNIDEGKKFHNDMTRMLVKLQRKVIDFCFARMTEKDNLLKDISTNPANQSGSLPPQPSGPAVSPTPVFFSPALPRSFNPYSHFRVGGSQPSDAYQWR